MENYIWLFATAGGAFLLGAVLAFGVLRQKRLRPADKRRQDEKVKRLYEKH
ncbi:hypothetical protein [Pararhizobium arenae]|uniref:hypothetical protein n=1 Tax=Pararhizobium arenae TaxID=1856850 RepID=UPI000B16D022|nr:hypothetical protein [Pararhizobium arenae]